MPTPSDRLAVDAVELVTFTGIDATTNPADIERLHRRYPATEFGVLIGGRNTNRHQSPATAERWRDFSQETGVPFALHLCSACSRYVNTAEPAEAAAAVVELCGGFGRVQVNDTRYDYDRVAAFADAAAVGSVILQHRGPFWTAMPLDHPKVEYLFDQSGGRGRVGFDEWPAPADSGTRVGYAGGITPDNITTAVAAVAAFAPARVWLDMETGVRTDDRFDLDKVEAVCLAVFGPADAA